MTDDNRKFLQEKETELRRSLQLTAHRFVKFGEWSTIAYLRIWANMIKNDIEKLADIEHQLKNKEHTC